MGLSLIVEIAGKWKKVVGRKMVVISNSALFVCQSRPKAQYAIAGEISSPRPLLTVLQGSLKIRNCLSILYLFYIGIAWVLILAQVKSVI